MRTVSPNMEASPLPDDVALLQAMVKSQSLMIQKLMLQLAAHRRHRFGTRSESLDQLDLALDEVDCNAGASTPADIVEGVSNDDEAPKRKRLPAHLPRYRQTFAPASTDCPCCGKPMRKMAEDAREVVDYLPARTSILPVRPWPAGCRKWPTCWCR